MQVTSYSYILQKRIAMSSLDQVLRKPEVMDLWDRGTVIMRLNGEVVFRIQYNYEISVDKLQLIDVDTAEFTDAIRKYDVINIQTLDDQLIVDIIKKKEGTEV